MQSEELYYDHYKDSFAQQKKLFGNSRQANIISYSLGCSYFIVEQ